MDERTHSFGYWLKRRRKALDMTQEALAARVSCSGYAIRKIEAGERRPSRPLAERLAEALGVPDGERAAFVDAARSVGRPEPLPVDSRPRRATDAAPALPTDATPSAEATPLVGRDRELARLDALLEAVRRGGRRLALVEGEPGIGKSRLLREIGRHARQAEVPMFALRCYEIERSTPYQSVVELISIALARAPQGALDRLAPVALAELAALSPAVAECFPGLPELARDFPEARQARMMRAIDELLAAARGDRPLVLALDDAQWADEASARVFHYLGRQRGGWPLLAIYAYRDEELGENARLAQWADSLERDAAEVRLRLARLAPEDTGRLLAASDDPRLGSAASVARLHRESEGNPFFLTALLHGVASDEGTPGGTAVALPDALRAAIRTRLDQVPRDIRPILDTAAVIGRRFDFDTLLAAGRETEHWLLDGLERLVGRGLLREEADGGIYDFSHDKLREVAYAEIGGARRRLLHGAVAAALEGAHNIAPAERGARLAEHFERSHQWSRALDPLLRTAERAQHLFAMGEALRWLDRAVALADAHPAAADDTARLDLYERRGIARAQAGVTDGAVEDIGRVIEAARASGDRARLRDLTIQLGMAYRRADAYDRARECLLEALDESRALDDHWHVADTLYHLGTVAWSIGRNGLAITHHQEAVDICQAEGFADLAAVQAWHGRGEAYFADAEPVAAIDSYRRSIELARAIGDRSYESENLMMIGHAQCGGRGIADYPGAEQSFAAALGIARDADLQWHLGPTLLGQQHVWACTGRYGEAWTQMQETMTWLVGVDQVRYQMIGHDFAAQLLLDLGLDREARGQAETALALIRDTGIRFWETTLLADLVIACCRAGEPEAAPALANTIATARDNRERYLLLRCLEAAAERAIATGDAAAARTAADELLAIGTANDLAEMAAVAHRWQAEAWLLDGRPDEARRALTVCRDSAQGIGRVRLELDAERLLARIARASGDTGVAAGHRRRAEEIATAIEATLEGSGLQAQWPTFD
ncbi:MAG: AAA family ATPase [Rhodocyclaceae bacterium]|nr:AAA family ATPase [Rhodocyclaceae bacterium]